MSEVKLKLFISITTMIMILACNTSQDSIGYNSSVMVDLGDGNAEAAAQYQNMQVNCKDSDMVVTSFSGFQGKSENLSQQGMESFEKAEALGQTAAEPANEVIKNEPAGNVESNTSSGNESPASGTQAAAVQQPTAGLALQNYNSGGASTREQVIDVDGKPVRVCFATLPVNHTAAALAHKVVQESGARKVVSMGESSVGRVEAGATNYINANRVYDANGRLIDQSSSSRRVVEGVVQGDEVVPLGQEDTVDHTWKKNAVSDATGIRVEQGARPENQYICNATGYVLSKSITSQQELQYMPGVRLKPLNSNIEQGFLHVEKGQSPQQVEQALRSLIRSEYRPAGN